MGLTFIYKLQLLGPSSEMDQNKVQQDFKVTFGCVFVLIELIFCEF